MNPYDWVKRNDDGTFAIDVPDEERKGLRMLAAELRELLTGDMSSVHRLFPPAYTDDVDRQREYDELMRGELQQSHLHAIDTMDMLLDASMATEDELLVLLKAVNQIRLVIGSNLGITDDLHEVGFEENDPRAPGLSLVEALGGVQHVIIEAMSGGDEEQPENRMGDN